MTSCYISCACNRVPHSADWGRNGFICYAACQAIAIYDPTIGKIGRVIETLYRHTDRVNTVKWIKPKYQEPELELLSCSIDGNAIIWSTIKGQFQCTSVINVGEALIIGHALYLSNDILCENDKFTKLLLCTGTANGQFKLWVRETCGTVTCIQTLTFGKKLPIDACLSYLPNSDLPILAIATEDSFIELYVPDCLTEDKLVFVKVQTLLGHEDWIRCMDFSKSIDNYVLLATGSQDAMIRLWKFSVNTLKPNEEELQQKKQIFVANNVEYHITSESVLYGHEGWVYGINWHPVQKKDGKYYQPLKLLSSSIDKSMIIWEPDASSGIWAEKVRVGEVGGNSLGFYGCKFNGDGTSIFAHGYQGSFHIWKYVSELKNWIPRSVPGGHFAEVVDICWDPKGRFLLSASIDQTTRIHAPLKDEGRELWHEIGRPQVHGYDMSCITMLAPYLFASGAEEKVVRIFIAPTTFKNQLKKIADANDFENMTADSASVPALGLTNKGTFDEKKEIILNTALSEEEYTPPTEEDLMQNTLWPEQQKLYGHGYEIYAIAATHNGSFLATACKSRTADHAAIILWNTKTWTQIQKYLAHQLTVTQMEFSPNDKYLVSVSRDRRWSLLEFDGTGYNLVAGSQKKDSLHTRIIWCCAWTDDSKFFATGSRDGKVGIWNPPFESNTVNPTTYLDMKNNSITALAFSPYKISEAFYLLAIGYENGCIDIQKLKIHDNGCEWEKYLTFDCSQAHHLTVKRLKYRPQTNDSKNHLQLASCGSDHTVKIYNINISDL